MSFVALEVGRGAHPDTTRTPGLLADGLAQETGDLIDLLGSLQRDDAEIELGIGGIGEAFLDRAVDLTDVAAFLDAELAAS